MNARWYQIGRAANQQCAQFTGTYADFSGTNRTGGGGVDWGNNSGTPTTTTIQGVTMTVTSSTTNATVGFGTGTTDNPGCGTTWSCSDPGVATSWPNFGCTSVGTNSVGAPNQFTNYGTGINVVLGAGAAPSASVTYSFSKPICGFMIRLRDFSWYNGGSNGASGGRDAVWFSQTPSVRDDSVGTSMSGLTGTGISQATAVRRTQAGSEPVNATGTAGWYSDVFFVFGPIASSLTMTLFNTGTGAGDPAPVAMPSGKTGFAQVKLARILI